MPLQVVATTVATVVDLPITMATGDLVGITTALEPVAIPTVLPQVKVKMRVMTRPRRCAIKIARLLSQKKA